MELRRVRLPLRHPHITATGTEADRDVVIVRVDEADGAVGWGECSALSAPTYTSEWTDGAWLVLRDHLVPAVLAGRPSGVRGHPMATAAVETARLDAFCRRAGRSLAGHLGAARREVLSCTVVGLGRSVDEVLARVDGAPGPVKIKIAPGWDLEPLAAARAAWPDRFIAADANGTYDLDDPDHARALLALDDLGLAYLEQPTDPADLTAAATAAGRLATPVALDEALDAPGTVRTALALHAAGVVNLKPARLGGPRAALEAASLAAAAGVAVFVGGMLETGVGRAAALAVASVLPGDLPTDLGPSDRYFAHDIVVPAVGAASSAAHVCVPCGSGLGVDVDLERLAACTTDVVELAR
ncbi:MAG: o-succinylbenzoate synthase [Actinobacteria bacterium]|nr:o-succinylbenzoate synthase [Actinomycetota bacterium]